MSADASDRLLPSPVPDLVGVLAQFVARPDRAARVSEGLLRVVDGARTEDGNLDYDLYQVDGQPWLFYVLANWADQEAATAHLTSSYVRDFVAAHAETDLAAPPTRTNARMLSHPAVDRGRERPVPNSDQLTFFPFFATRPGRLDAVGEALRGAVDTTRDEPGCLDEDLYQAFDDPTTLFYRENWTDRGALDEHLNTPAFYDVVRGQVDPRLTVPWSGLSMMMVSDPGPIRLPG
jgi:quinol monooxygenase YgiN